MSQQDKNPIDEYWLAHYVNPDVLLCCLCGNTGYIDTRGRAVSPMGVDAGQRVPCICPNGRAERERIGELS